MESSIFGQASEFLREHKAAARALSIFLCLAVVVCLATIGMLTFTGHAMTKKVKTLACDFQPHAHTADCYDAAGEPKCGYADYVVHVHNDDCYDEEDNLVCPLPELWPHTHTESCYEDVKTLVCGLEENPGHQHTESCYDRQRGELTCAIPEHTHTDACFQRESVLTCTLTEQPHEHDDSCYTVTRELTCGLEESEEHTHSDDCYTESRVLTCDKTVDPHEHGDSCYTVNETLICQEQEHSHTDECYSWTETLLCQIPEGEGAHTHTDACYEITGQELKCGKLELHEHTDECFELDDEGNRIGDPVCGQIELLEHVHGEDCFIIEEVAVEEPEDEAGAAETGCYDEEGNLICRIEEHVHDESCLSEDGSELICGKEEHSHTQAAAQETQAPEALLPAGPLTKTYEDGSVVVTASYGEEAGIPEEARLVATRITPGSDPNAYEEYLSSVRDAMSEADLSQAVLYDIGFYMPDGSELEPAAPVTVSIRFLQEELPGESSLTVVHFAEEGTELLPAVNDGSSISFETDSFSPFLTGIRNFFAIVGGEKQVNLMAAGDPNDLSGFIQGMSIQRRNPDTGEWEDLPGGANMVVGNNYRLNVHFEGGEKNFTSPMTWSLGDNVQCQPVENGVLMNGTTQVGTYSLTEDGQLTVNFTDDFLNGTNHKLDMYFEFVPTDTGGSEKNPFPWSGHITDHKVVEANAQLHVEKEAGYYSADGHTITYTVEASVTQGMIKEGKLSDDMGKGLSFHGLDSVTILDANGKDVTDRYKDEIDALKASAETQKGRTDWELSPLPALSEGMSFNIKYRADVAEKYWKDKEYTAENMVTFTGKNPDGKTQPEPSSDKAEKSLAKDQMTKTGSTTVIEVDGEEKEVIQWTVRVGSGQWDPLETNPLTVTDKLGKGLSFFEGDKIHVQAYDKNGNKRPYSYDIDWNDVTKSDGGKTAQYQLDKNKMPGYTWADGDYLEITYYTEYNRDQQPSSGFSNTVLSDITGPEGTTGKLPVGEAIQKRQIDNEAEGYITYEVVADIPPCSHIAEMGSESDEHDGLHYFYIEDQLDFGDDYFALNIPENVSVRVQATDSSSYDEYFSQVEYLSGGGDGQERETFQIVQGPESRNKTEEGRNHRAFRLYFNVARYGLGNDGTLDRHDSIWDLDFPTRMTITYKIPYDTVVVNADGTDTGLTVGELLAQGRELKNKALYKRSGVSMENSVLLQKNPSEGSISKKATYKGDGIVEYRVRFDNRDSNGDRIVTNGELKNLCPIIFHDSFDEKMEYVDGSLKVEVHSFDNDRTYATWEFSKNGSPVVEGKNELSAQVVYLADPEHSSSKTSDFANRTSDDGNADHYANSETVADAFTDKRYFVFIYQLRLKDEYRDWEPDTVDNTAELTMTGKDYTDAAEITIPADMLQKSFETTPEGNLRYTLDVNTAAADLVQVATGEGFVNLSSYKLVDKMSENLQLLTKLDGSYDITVQYQTEDGEWAALEQSPSPDSIAKEYHNYYLGTEGDNDIYFILPDNLHIRIVYTVMVNGTFNTQELASNEATLYADYKESDKRVTVYEVGTSGGTASSSPTIRLVKEDEESGKQLQGAKFALYSSLAAKSDRFIQVTQNGETITLYYVRDYETGSLGQINNITPPDGVESDLGAGLYALVETQAPSGYTASDSPTFFRYPGDQRPSGTETLTYLDQEIQVQHPAVQGTLTVTNPPTHSFVLPESGGEGLGALYAVGMAMLLLGSVMLLERSRRRRER